MKYHFFNKNVFQIGDTYDLREKALNRCVELTQQNLTAAKANATGTEIRPLQLAVSQLLSFKLSESKTSFHKLVIIHL